MKATTTTAAPATRYEVAFQGGPSLHLRDYESVDFMTIYDPQGSGDFLRDEDDDLLLYVEVGTDDDPTDDSGNPLDEYCHYDELKAMLLDQAAAHGIPAEQLVFPCDD